MGTLGLLYRCPSPGEPIVGMQVAVDQLVRALDQHVTMDARIFAGARAVPAIEERFKLAPDRAGRRALRIANESTLRDTPIDAWHELAFDAKRPFAVRRALGGAFPITLTHHTLSYRELAHDVILRLLLEGPAPYDSVFCSTTAARDALRKLLAHVADTMNENHGTRLDYRGRLDVVPLGVDTERFKPRDRADARARCGLPPDMFMLLWVGRLSSIDKADLLPLVRAVAELARAHPAKKVTLMCVGGERAAEGFGRVITEYAHQLGAAENVLVASEVPPGGAHLVHSAADVFVSPVDNIQETFGLTPVEAMACGIPQVVSDWNGYRDTVVDGETGFRVPTVWGHCDGDLRAAAPFRDPADDHLTLAQSVVVDPAALHDRLEQLIVNDELRRSMGEKSRERALRLYAIDRMIAAHEELWRELAAHASAEPLPPRTRAIDDVPYYEIFDHYATRALSEADTIELTALGADVIAGRVRPRMSIQWPGLHDVSLYKSILAAVQQSPQRVGIVGNDSRSLRAVLWLMKYGYVRAG